MEKTVFISIPINELQTVIIDCVNACLRNNKQTPPAKPDRCTLDEAVEITGLSKSKLYKLTSSNGIAFKRYGNRLIFSRKELLEWVEEQTVEKSSDDATSLLAASARRKMKGGDRA